MRRAVLFFVPAALLLALATTAIAEDAIEAGAAGASGAAGVSSAATVSSTAGLSDSAGVSEAAHRGRLMMIGGSLRDDNAAVWSELARLAGGPGGRVAIFPTASGAPERMGEKYSELTRAVGLDPFVVPAAPELKSTDYRQVAHDADWTERVRQADAVFLAGGDQSRYLRVLYDADGAPTPLLDAIWHVYRKGGVIAGTSAGTAIMSRMMFTGSSSLTAMLKGVERGKQVDRGLGFLPGEWFVDQHFFERGRFGRTLVAMQKLQIPYGLGIAENTAVVVEQGQTARVVGYRGALFMDSSASIVNPDEARFNVSGVRLSYLSHGDSINLKTREVSLAPEKLPEDKIDPNSPDFMPDDDENDLLFYINVLADSTLVRLMLKLVTTRHDEASGLAFDGAAAQQGPTPGFEFRFYRRQDTVGWDPLTADGDSHTVLNVHLDVKPVEVQGLSYK